MVVLGRVINYGRYASDSSQPIHIVLFVVTSVAKPAAEPALAHAVSCFQPAVSAAEGTIIPGGECGPSVGSGGGEGGRGSGSGLGGNASPIRWLCTILRRSPQLQSGQSGLI